jgi:hypothetical protein
MARFCGHGYSSIWPHSRVTVATMRTVVVIFVLALITIAIEVISDARLTSAEFSHTAAPDPAIAAIAHGLKPW